MNGSLVNWADAKIHIASHVIQYGSGVFEGARCYDTPKGSVLFRLDAHTTRLYNSAKIYRMPIPMEPAEFNEAIVQTIRANNFTNCYIRPLAFFTDQSIGVRLYDLTADVTIASIPFGSYLSNEEGLHVGTSSWIRVEDNMIPARGKIAGAYVNSSLIKTEAHFNGYDEALVLNQSGHVAEASAANFFMIRRGIACTPPVTDNILEGIVRRTIIQLLRDEFGMEVVERSIDRTEVYLADEAFLCGTGVQVAAIAKVDHHPLGAGKMGPVTQKLRKLFFDIMRGRVPKYMDWCFPLYQQKAAAK
jgi:branched-chain amino acid aminotransferase